MFFPSGPSLSFSAFPSAPLVCCTISLLVIYVLRVLSHKHQVYAELFPRLPKVCCTLVLYFAFFSNFFFVAALPHKHWVEQGWRSSQSTRLPPIWPGLKSRLRLHMLVEFVVGSLLCSERFFSGYSGFPLSSKTNTSKFQFHLECMDTFKRVHMNS